MQKIIKIRKDDPRGWVENSYLADFIPGTQRDSLQSDFNIGFKIRYAWEDALVLILVLESDKP